MCGCGRLMLFVRHTLGSFPFWSTIYLPIESCFWIFKRVVRFSFRRFVFQVEPGETVASSWQTVTGWKDPLSSHPDFCPPNSPGGPTFNTISNAIPQCPNALRCFWEYRSATNQWYFWTLGMSTCKSSVKWCSRWKWRFVASAFKLQGLETVAFVKLLFAVEWDALKWEALAVKHFDFRSSDQLSPSSDQLHPSMKDSTQRQLPTKWLRFSSSCKCLPFYLDQENTRNLQIAPHNSVLNDVKTQFLNPFKTGFKRSMPSCNSAPNRRDLWCGPHTTYQSPTRYRRQSTVPP